MSITTSYFHTMRYEVATKTNDTLTLAFRFKHYEGITKEYSHFIIDFPAKTDWIQLDTQDGSVVYSVDRTCYIRRTNRNLVFFMYSENLMIRVNAYDSDFIRDMSLINNEASVPNWHMYINEFDKGMCYISFHDSANNKDVVFQKPFMVDIKKFEMMTPFSAAYSDAIIIIIPHTHSYHVTYSMIVNNKSASPKTVTMECVYKNNTFSTPYKRS